MTLRPDNEKSEHEIPAGQIAKAMKLPYPVTVNWEVALLAKRIIQLSGNKSEIERRKNGTIRWWTVLFTGRFTSKPRAFIWTLRPELEQAVNECLVGSHERQRDKL